MTANEKEIELGYWNQPGAMFYEERKQYVYARLMGIKRAFSGFVVGGKSIIDIGGGPCSMLLKCHDLGDRCVVADPLLDKYPRWVSERYVASKILPWNIRGEDIFAGMNAGTFDECWIYNCLQHVDDPGLIVRNALEISHRVRIFEWVNIPPHAGHPHMLTEAKLNEWLSATPVAWGGGEVHQLNYEGCFGDAYVAVVKGLAT